MFLLELVFGKRLFFFIVFRKMFKNREVVLVILDYYFWVLGKLIIIDYIYELGKFVINDVFRLCICVCIVWWYWVIRFVRNLY